MTFRGAIAIWYSLLIILTSYEPIHAQALPPCGSLRLTSITSPWSGAGDLWCLEKVLDDNSVGSVGYTQIVTVPDSSLYAVMPWHSQIAHITDTDGDALPDSAKIILENIPRPTGITYYDGAIYISGNEFIHRYTPETDQLDTLVNDIPWGYTGYPTGGLTIFENRLYIGAGGDIACTQGRGAIYSYDLNGTDQQLIANGLRSPADLTIFQDKLWVVDTDTDRLMQVEAGADYGACSNAPPPDVITYTFADGSAPIALAAYNHDLFPMIANRLLVAQRGNVGNVIIQGYKVEALAFDGLQFTNPEAVLPRNSPHLNITDQRMNIQGTGFYPHHVYGVATDTNGWVYVSAGNGFIVALRPLGTPEN